MEDSLHLGAGASNGLIWMKRVREVFSAGSSTIQIVTWLHLFPGEYSKARQPVQEKGLKV
jgi:hypothetical protein